MNRSKPRVVLRRQVRPFTPASADPLSPLEWHGDSLTILDQTRLPWKLKRRKLRTVEDVSEAIRTLRVRGAPLIGIAAAYGAVLAMQSNLKHRTYGSRVRAWKRAIRALLSTRPTAVNLGEALQRMERVGVTLLRSRNPPLVLLSELGKEAQRIHADEADRCWKIGSCGAKVVPNHARILTICNTGALATGGIGTALGVIRIAHEQGKVRMVWLMETRPLLQGARLSALELHHLRIPYRIVVDGAIGALFYRKLVDLVIVGADRIARNGDFANKIGTLPIFALAKLSDVPAYVAAPLTTFDPQCRDGKGIPIEERSEEEVLSIFERKIAPESARAFNPAFDVVPAHLVSGFITDRGLFSADQLADLIKHSSLR
ncbi:MAG: S-methyl-5-thioribose-1-phosphate isomerase [bacterium JZ-2024 1]